MIEIKPFSCCEKIGKIEDGICQQGNEKDPKKSGERFLGVFRRGMKERIKNKPHKNRDGDSPTDGGEKSNVSANISEIIFIIPETYVKNMIEEKSCQKLKERSKQPREKKVSDVTGNRTLFENVFAEKSHLLRCTK